MTQNNRLNKFIKSYGLGEKERALNGNISIVSAEDLTQLKSEGYSLEDLLNYISQQYQSLFHGSRVDISDDYLRPNNGEVYCSNQPAIAIMKAIVSSKRLTYPGLEYPYFIDKEHPLILKINGINEDTIGKEGFVYIINDRNGFKNLPEGAWQYVTTNQNVPILVKIPVKKEDFTYPIFDITNNRRIQ